MKTAQLDLITLRAHTISRTVDRQTDQTALRRALTSDCIAQLTRLVLRTQVAAEISQYRQLILVDLELSLHVCSVIRMLSVQKQW